MDAASSCFSFCALAAACSVALGLAALAAGPAAGVSPAIRPLGASPATAAPGDVPDGTTFHTDAASCAAAARESAGDAAVMMHGASAAQAFLAAGELDELEIHLVPVLLGDGRRLFDVTGGSRTELELVRRLEGSDATHLLYRIVG